jgi:hypothetical protein
VLSVLLMSAVREESLMLMRGAMEEEDESQTESEILLLMCWLGSGRHIPRRRRDGDLTVGLYLMKTFKDSGQVLRRVYWKYCIVRLLLNDYRTPRR